MWSCIFAKLVYLTLTQALKGRLTPKGAICLNLAACFALAGLVYSLCDVPCGKHWVWK
jgi:hypothetical protein